MPHLSDRRRDATGVKRLLGTRLSSILGTGQAASRRAAVPLEDISVSTVIINAKDDTISAFGNAEQAAGRVPHAKLVAIETGGRLLLGSERRVEEELRSITGR